VIGHPARHSLSPVLHNAALHALGLDWVYLAFEVAPEALVGAVAGVRALGIEGLSVTMPHKTPLAALLDGISPVCAQLGAVNTVVRRGEGLWGESTDGAGLVDALRGDEGWDPAGKRIVVLGTGGAARAVTLALAEAGAAQLVVVGRRPERARRTAALAGAVGRVGGPEDASEADAVINATPVGMHRGEDRPEPGPGLRPLDVAEELPLGVSAASFGPGQLVVDLIYAPPLTPLLAAARARGAAGVNGIGMLIEQAALQIRLWTGEDPPRVAMSAAALAALSHRG